MTLTRLPGAAFGAHGHAKSPLGFSWNNEWGTRSRAAVYAGAEFGNDGSTSSSSCGGAAFAGVYVFNQQKEVLRLEGEVRASSTSSVAAVAASSELFVLGDSVWSKSGNFSISPLTYEKSFSVSKSFTYWGLVTINLAAKTTASASLSGSLTGTASSGAYSCAVSLTPGVKAKLGGSAEVALLGYGNLSAAAVGVEADVTLADVSVPITASAAVAKVGSAVCWSTGASRGTRPCSGSSADGRTRRSALTRSCAATSMALPAGLGSTRSSSAPKRRTSTGSMSRCTSTASPARRVAGYWRAPSAGAVGGADRWMYKEPGMDT